jgi:ribonucleoside-diphosphate reductase alpha chain
MIRQYIDEDSAIKQSLDQPGQPRFSWAQLNLPERLAGPITLEAQGQHKHFTLSEVAEKVGSALTALLLARSTAQDSIFSQDNQAFVAKITQIVDQDLGQQLEQRPSRVISEHELYRVMEKALLTCNAHDVAKILWTQRSRQGEAQHPVPHTALGLRLIRRNQQVVPWNTHKIEIAVRKAFLSLGLDSSPAPEVARCVTERVQALGQSFVDIETVQDCVQEELMRAGFYKVAETYILYRAYRTQQRNEAALANPASTAQDSQQQDALVLVQKDDSSETFLWDGTELRKRIEFASIGLDLCLSREEIETALRRSIFSEIKQSDLQKTIILNAKALMEKDADFAKFAGRILLSYLYEEVLGWSIVRDGKEKLKDFHVRAFRSSIEYGVRIERLDAKLLEYDLDKLAEALDPWADLDFDYLGIQTLYDRYLIVDKTTKVHRRLETPQMFWMRVAAGLFYNEKSQKESWAIQLYQLYKSRRFCSSTPTLFNSGTRHSQLSSCYLFKVDDSIESIMHRGIADNAFLAKWAGGLGGSWTSVRGTGSYIKGTNGESQGVVPFLKIFNDVLGAVNQGGKRKGTGVAYLETWHNDIADFLELRRNTGDERRRTHEMNTANWIPDLFMKRMEARQHWTLFHSNQVPDLHELYGKAFEARYAQYEALAEEGKIFGQKVPAIDLWKEMLSMLFETGHPWITFKDACNIRSPQDHVGVIHSSNLCTEITLNTSADETAVCNLGSVVLHTHLRADGSLDFDLLRETVRIAVRALDNVIDINFYPTPSAHNANMRHRPVGLGVMGLQNALYVKGLPFDSDEAVAFNHEFMEAIAYCAYEASSDLAAERGTYSSYAGSKWDRGLLPQDTLELLEQERGLPIDAPRHDTLDWSGLRAKIRQHGMRNSNVLAIAPTATISNIMGTVPCIEPVYKNLFNRSNLSGDFMVLNAYLVKDLKRLGLWDQEMLDQLKYFDGELTHIEGIPDNLKRLYKTAFDIPYAYIIRAASARQRYIDQAQSVNLFLVEPDLKTLSLMYRMAFHTGLKTTYYLRTLGASNIEKATINVKKTKRGLMAAEDNADAASKASLKANDAAAKSYSTAAQQACSLEAMLNGGTCEACQ